MLAKHPVKLLLVVVIGLAAYATLPPAGSILILHRNEEYIADADRLMRRGLSEANVRNFAANHVRRLLDQNFIPQNDLTEKFGIDRIQDVIDANLGAEKKEGFLRGSLGVDITALVQSYVDSYFSAASTILIVDDFIKGSGEGASTTPRVVITANRVATREFGGGEVSESNLIGQIATFLITFFYDRSADCDIEFCAKHFPSQVEDIKRVSKIMSALSQEKILGVCAGVDDEFECITQIRSELNALEDDFLVKDILLLLTEFTNLKLAIAQSRAAKEIGDTLDRIHRQLIKVKRIEQFSYVSQDEETLQHFLASVGKDDLELTHDFLSTLENYQTGRIAVQSGRPLTALVSFRKVKSPPSWFKGYLSGVTLVHSFNAQTQDISASLNFIDELLASEFDAEYIKKGLAGLLYRQLVEARLNDLDPATLKRLEMEIPAIWSDAVSLTSSSADRIGAQIEQARALHALFGQQEERLKELLVELDAVERDTSFRNAYMSAAMFTSILGWTEKTKRLLEYSFHLYPRNLCAYQGQPEFEVFRRNFGVEHDEWLSEQREMHGPPC